MKAKLQALRVLALRQSGKVAAVGTSLVVASGSAVAAVPANVTTALTDGLADATTVAGLALIIVIAVVVFKKMGSAAK